ncbi:hypothetical protein [Ensifer sp. 4252]|uniref:hypothetical protein n=1 Tax=Ensifer sp. 4252 TaxID=3373915 RepID=UPI003D231C78
MMHADGCSIGFQSSSTASCKSTSQDEQVIKMTCDVLEHTERKPVLSLDAVVRFTSTLFRGAVAAKPILDVNALSDHLKRDMGFMDWHGAHEDDDEAIANSRRLLNIDELPRI